MIQVINYLATSLNRRDEVPNQELARMIVDKDDHEAVQDLVNLLQHKSKDIQHDAIKVIYEIGALKPDLIASYISNFIALLSHKSNRMQWGGMMALSSAAVIASKKIYKVLPEIMDAADRGSVITKDHAVNILIALAKVPEYTSNSLTLLNEQLTICPTNQLAMYAERALPAISKKYQPLFRVTLEMRLKEVDQESKKKRLEKVLRKLAS